MPAPATIFCDVAVYAITSHGSVTHSLIASWTKEDEDDFEVTQT